MYRELSQKTVWLVVVLDEKIVEHFFFRSVTILRKSIIKGVSGVAINRKEFVIVM
jgi:hypothetical protein